MTLVKLYDELVKNLRQTGLGKFNTRIQEKLEMYHEFEVIVADLSVEVESPTSYLVDMVCNVRFIGDDSQKMLSVIDRLIVQLEQQTFTQPVTMQVEDIVFSVEGVFIVATIVVRLKGAIEIGN